jgi:putative ABC transport system permease protein
MIIFYLLKESFIFAINSLVTNKLRTFLSLLMITIGVFIIIFVFTVIDSLELSIRTSISKLGDNVVYVQKWPWTEDDTGEYKWWDYLSRPVTKINESKEIMKRSILAQAATFQISSQGKTVQYKDNYSNDISLIAAEHNYEEIRSFEIERGRYFSMFESHNGKNKAILGNEVAKKLFLNETPIGKAIKIEGQKLIVIGVFKKEGSDMFGMSVDNQILIPINFMKTIVNIKSERLDPLVMIKARDGVSTDELIEELTGIMRSIRRLKPKEENNFSLNRTSLISKNLDDFFSVLDKAGWIIGGFSILVGGFGIANIMFVSVREQTKLIGIQKALGAKNHFILLQFLYESIVLTLIGGLIGLLLDFLLSIIITAATEMQFVMSMWNVALGLIISITIGIVAGIIPAYKAAKLNPVEAIAST